MKIFKQNSNILLSPKRIDLQNFLLEKGIYSKVYFFPIHLKTYYREKFGYNNGDLPITENISKKIITIPFSLRFSNQDQDYIIKTIEKFFNQI